MQPLSITRRVDLDIDADQLWAALSDPAQLAAWLGDEVDLDVRQGGAGTVVDDGILRHVRSDHVSEGRELAFTWWEADQPNVASTVRFEVEQRPAGGSRLAIVETFDPDSGGSSVAKARAVAAQRWGVRVMCLWACTVTAVALVR
jgi:uncharacterized protein YndB with AHSA1/START domain